MALLSVSHPRRSTVQLNVWRARLVTTVTAKTSLNANRQMEVGTHVGYWWVQTSEDGGTLV